MLSRRPPPPPRAELLSLGSVASPRISLSPVSKMSLFWAVLGLHPTMLFLPKNAGTEGLWLGSRHQRVPPRIGFPRRALRSRAQPGPAAPSPGSAIPRPARSGPRRRAPPASAFRRVLDSALRACAGPVMAPLRFSANVSWLFPELAGLPARLRAAGGSGFKAAEVAWPYAEPPEALAHAAREAGLRLVLINTPPGAPRGRGGGLREAREREPGLRPVLSAGDREKGEMGLGAVPGRQAAFREGLEQAVLYAKALGCPRYPTLSSTSSPPCPVCSKPLPHAWGLGERNAGLERFRSPRTGPSLCQSRSFVNCLLYFICPVSLCSPHFHAGIPCQDL